MTSHSYTAAWNFLDNLQFFKINLGLDAMTTFLAELDNPQHQVPTLHIGGTNGKGSVGATLHALLGQAGYRVGFYTSPHLDSVRERFRIGDDYISEQDFATEAQQIIELLDGRQISYFEFTTTLAFSWFAHQKVDLAIMEVGMGGRLDATNVITPLVSVITNVSLDHESYLGDHIAAIAEEKAGIIKSQIPVICGAKDPVVQTIIQQQCQQQQAPFYLAGEDFHTRPLGTAATTPSPKKTCHHCWQYQPITTLSQPPFQQTLTNLPLNLLGHHQIENSGLALAALQVLTTKGYSISREQLSSGLASTHWPGRLEWFHADPVQKTAPHLPHHPTSPTAQTRQYLLDGAHNEAGVDALIAVIEQQFKTISCTLIWAAMTDKKQTATLTKIAPYADHIILTQPNNERAATPKQLFAHIPEGKKAVTYCYSRIEEALEQAQQMSGPTDLICVAGSLFLIGHVRRQLLGQRVDHHG